MTRRLWYEASVFLMTFFGISLFVYLFLNGGAYWRELRYALFLQSPFAGAELKEGEILEVKSAAAHEAPEVPLASGAYRLRVPKIGVEAPITVPEENTKHGVLASLEEGVGLYPGSAEPGETGRTIILGHSSRASWYRGDYATIFALLPKLETFDVFYITGGNKKYTYQVFRTQVLSPAETNKFLATTPGESEVDLVTCYPIGSASQRTIIQAKLVSEENI